MTKDELICWAVYTFCLLCIGFFAGVISAGFAKGLLCG